MSMMFMLFALLGALLVLGGGSYALHQLLAFQERRPTTAEEPPVPEPSAEPVPHVGGYVPVLRDPDGLPPALRARVQDLVALGRTEEAVRMVREDVDGDEGRARRIVSGLGGDGTGRALGG